MLGCNSARKTTKAVLSGVLFLLLALGAFPHRGIAYALDESVEEGDPTVVQMGEDGPAPNLQVQTGETVATVTIGMDSPTSYNTFSEALSVFNNTNESATLTLQQDVTVSDTGLTFSGSPGEGNAKTVDLNGKTLTSNTVYFGAQYSNPATPPILNLQGEGTIVGKVYAGPFEDKNCVLNMNDNVTIQAPEDNIKAPGVTVCSYSTFTMNGGTITGHTNNVGGGVYVAHDATFTLAGGKIIGNTATDQGGGVYVAHDATFTLAGGKIIGNAAAYQGGGVYVAYELDRINTVDGYAYERHPGVFTMTGGEISGNTATDQGGGVYLKVGTGSDTSGATFKVSGSPIIAGNTLVTGTGASATSVTNNLCVLDTNTVIVIGKFNEGAQIGVTLKTWPGPGRSCISFTEGYKGYNALNPATYFESDMPYNDASAAMGEGFFVGWDTDSSEEVAVRLHQHKWKTTSTSGNDAVTLELSCDGDGLDACLLGQRNYSLTLTAKDKVYDGKDVAQTKDVSLAVSQDWTADCVTYNNIPQPQPIRYSDGTSEWGESSPYNAKTYSAIARVTQAINGTDTVELTKATKEFTIKPRPVTVVCDKTEFVYNGKSQGPRVVDLDNLVKDGDLDPSTDIELVGGTLAATNIGSYTAKFKVKDDERSSTQSQGKVHTSLQGKPLRSNYVIASDVAWSIVAPKANATYSARVQGVGDQPAVSNGATSGTTGQSKRLEAIGVKVDQGSIEYRSHVQGSGWESSWAKDGGRSGAADQAKRIEAVQMRLAGIVAQTSDVFYRVHSQTYGWLGWAKNGEPAGTAGLSKRAEAYQVIVLPKGETPKDYVAGRAAYIGASTGNVHVQGKGWTGAKSALTFGTTGQGRRLEAVRFNVSGQPESGGIEYQVHVQSKGWMPTKANGELAGTTGESKRIEAVKVRLIGNMKAKYSVWYRVHSQTYGWLGWTHDGAVAGTTGLAKRAEAIEVQILPQGQVPGGYDASQAAYRSK